MADMLEESADDIQPGPAHDAPLSRIVSDDGSITLHSSPKPKRAGAPADPVDLPGVADKGTARASSLGSFSVGVAWLVKRASTSPKLRRRAPGRRVNG